MTAVGSQGGAPMLEGRERFPAYVAHELRTHLATQRALLELALTDPDADEASWREVAEAVLRACLQQERLLDACLMFARSQGKLLRREPVDLVAIAAEALQAHHPGELERVVVLEPAWTTGDPTLVERLAANLISNAIRHNIVGGQIEFRTRTESGCAVLSVANTGPSIPAGELPRLFLPFQRLNAEPRVSADGVGLRVAAGVQFGKALAGLARPSLFCWFRGRSEQGASGISLRRGADVTGLDGNRGSPGRRVRCVRRR